MEHLPTNLPQSFWPMYPMAKPPVYLPVPGTRHRCTHSCHTTRHARDNHRAACLLERSWSNPTRASYCTLIPGKNKVKVEKMDETFKCVFLFKSNFHICFKISCPFCKMKFKGVYPIVYPAWICFDLRGLRISPIFS